MRFEVPQFIEIEDKIIGPLTWKQFVYLAGGMGVLIALYFILPFLLFIMFGVPFAALAGSLAFHKINNRPFSIFLESCVNYLRKNKLYLWRREQMQSVTEKAEFVGSSSSLDFAGKKSLTSLSRKLDLHVKE